MTSSVHDPDWLQAVQERLDTVEAERALVAQEIAQLENAARRLSEERVHLMALLELPRDESGPGPKPDNGASPGMLQLSTAGAKTMLVEQATIDVPGPSSTQVWKTVVKELLASRGQAAHYQILYQDLRRLGLSFGGQNPAASFLAVLNRDGEFVRVGRGMYWLKGHTPAGPPPAPPHRGRKSKARVRKTA